jgi:hypothetical protein
MYKTFTASGRWLLCALGAALLVGCGGSPPGPQSDSNAYGFAVADMQSAPESAPSSNGTLTIRALATRSTSFVSPSQTTFNPRTGQFEFDTSTSQSYEIWYVGLGFIDAADQSVASEWTVRTIWVMQGSRFLSSRDVSGKDGTFFITAFPNPPFSKSDTRIVAEIVRNAETRLISKALVWTN